MDDEPIEIERQQGNPDDNIRAVVQQWGRMNEEQIAEEYEKRGSSILERFQERHEDDMPDEVSQKLRETINLVNKLSSQYHDTRRPTTAKMIRHMIEDSVGPLILEVLKSTKRRRNARGGVDDVPSAATDRERAHLHEQHERISNDIEYQVQQLPLFHEYNAKVAAAQHARISPQEELEMHDMYMKLQSNKLARWQQENEHAHGEYSRDIYKLQKLIEKAGKKIQKITRELHGEGAPEPQRAQRAPRTD